MDAGIELLIKLVLTGGLLLGTWLVGSVAERRHFQSIAEREEAMRSLPAITMRTVPTDWQVQSSELVVGSVVVSLDYFKRFLAGLRQIFGGRITAYEPLLDRARREALLRMKHEAMSRGYDAVVNVRIDTSRLASSAQNGRGTAGVEIFAYGTALKRAA